jgi:AcrR family transcriptional regulator
MSNSITQGGATKRSYRLGRRAEQQEHTRQRIVEAAVELHSTFGPARTSIAQIAERAGVQRHTFYAHFPEECDLMEACSGLALERDPLPDAEQWTAVDAGKDRVRRGLMDLYAWYERNEQLTACVLRDAEVHAPTREIVGLRMGPIFLRAAEVLGESLSDRARSLLPAAISFHSWRALARTLSGIEAAALMADAIGGLDR